MIYLISSKNDFAQKNYHNLVNITIDIDMNPFVKYFIYIIDKNIIAYIKFEHIYDRIEIDNVFVHENYRNKGIASNLMKYLINYSTSFGIKNITIEVKKDNYNAIMLYKKFGFLSVAIREKYYNGIDGILMKREM